MKSKKGLIAVVAVAVIVLVVIFCNLKGSDKNAVSGPVSLSIATGGTSGTYYAVGGALAKAVSKEGKIQATAETGNASIANANLVDGGEIEIAFVQNDIAAWGANGELMFKDKPLKNIRAVASLYPEHIQFIIAKNTGIKTVDDLKGKRVGTGAPGSGTEGDVHAILDVAGINIKDLKADPLDFAQTSARFKDNQIEAGLVVAGYPTASIMDLTTAKDVDLLSFDQNFLAKLSKKYPFFIASKVPAGTYKGIDHDTNTPAVMAILIANADVAEDTIYNFLDAMYKNLEDIAAVHQKGKEIKIETAMEGISIPLHPGAEKFFTEKGILKK